MNDEAVEDAWILSSYLGDADILLAKLRGMLSSYNEAENVLQSAAASIAVRGALFGNSHPLSSRLSLICMQCSLRCLEKLNVCVIFLSIYFYRWHAIRRPKLWQVEKEALYRKVNSLWLLSLQIFYYPAMFQISI